jgi:serine/threonine protein kinase
LQTLHDGVSRVHVLASVITPGKRVGKQVSLLGREDTLAVNEAALLQEMDHPNVAKVFEVAEIAGSDPSLALFEIIMPYYADGSVLDAMVNRGVRYSVGSARDIAARALRGLAYLHDERGVLHRDIKPPNLFLSGDGDLVKIGDFGEAVQMDGHGIADPLITPQYWTAPETFTGSRYGVTCELYSMGMTLRELLSGPFPYDDYTRESMARRLAAGACAVLPRHLKFASHVPECLRRVVRKATRIESGDRYQSADAMIRDLLRARFIDWGWPDVSADEALWEGRWQGDRYRVTVRPVRGKGWRACAERLCSSGWRRIRGLADIDAHERVDAASAAFAQMDRQLVSV